MINNPESWFSRNFAGPTKKRGVDFPRLKHIPFNPQDRQEELWNMGG